MIDPNRDAESLLAYLIPFAEKTLRKYGEFFPFGGHLDADGEFAWDAVHAGSEMPPSATLIEMLTTMHQEQARLGTARACATVYDILIAPPGETQKRDAIAASIEHSDGYSVVVIFPYRISAKGELTLESPFAQAGEKRVFAASRH